MEEQKRDSLPPQPGLIDAFSAGFDLTANNVAVILLPLLFDLFLWLGPHLRISNIIRPFITNMVAFAPMAGIGSSDLSLVQTFWNDFADRFNVFALARTMPVGVPSLLSGSLPLESPLSAPTFIEVGGAGSFLFYWAVLAFAGWVLGAVFFNWVARITSPNKLDRSFVRDVSAVFHTIILSAAWVLVAAILGLPVFFLTSILALISPAVAQFAMLICMFIFLWILPLIYFSPHGIFVLQQNAFRSALTSFRMARFALPASGLFIFVVFLLSQGLNFLWLVPAEDSWWMLVGIAGHAFIASALLSSSFVYYRNVNAWIQVVTERYKTQATSARA